MTNNTTTQTRAQIEGLAAIAETDTVGEVQSFGDGAVSVLNLVTEAIDRVYRRAIDGAALQGVPADEARETFSTVFTPFFADVLEHAEALRIAGWERADVLRSIEDEDDEPEEDEDEPLAEWEKELIAEAEAEEAAKAAERERLRGIDDSLETLFAGLFGKDIAAAVRAEVDRERDAA